MRSIALSGLLFINAFSSYAIDFSNDSYRARMKARWQEKLAAEPAPVLSQTEGKLKPGQNSYSIKVNGVDRYYIIHVPKTYDEKKPAALILFMHGGGGYMFMKADDRRFGIISKAEAANFIAVIPNGYSKYASGKLATWNAGTCCSTSRDLKIDDVAFIRAMIEKIKTQVSVDPDRIFATGMSNGGMMVYRLACEMSDVIKGIAAIAGTDNTINCTPKNPVSVLQIHAKDDDQVLYEGGAGPASGDKTHVADYVSVPKTIEKWVKLNSCSAEPKRVFEVKGAYCDLYTGCKNQTEVKLCVTDKGGHTWPGGKYFRGKSSKLISANDLLWDFFSK